MGTRLAALARQAAADLAAYEQAAGDAAPVVRAALDTMLAAYRALGAHRQAFLQLLANSPIDAGTLLADLERAGLPATALCAPWLGRSPTQQVQSYAVPSIPPYGQVLYAEVERMMRAEVEAAREAAAYERFARSVGG